ncbi:exonuclease 1 isoform X2 [Cephus cinctus]|uniref:Exonuclease 1 n=1 Tax=Cephus cinctus TaxID=211228 RepID=A0AAJ7C0Z9_CEPCN|nr:exonuclease 1 isoform X2 [Cephus cinctus]
MDVIYLLRLKPKQSEESNGANLSRDANRRRAAELMRMGQTAEGRNLLRRSMDITHEMALNLIISCQRRNIDCIVAPYEADAQLAYLNLSGIADVVITEDSDLTLFGCKKIFFKMDVYGNGLLVQQDRLHLSMGIRIEHFDMDKFRYMGILSGCDYLASLPGIGLNKACRFIIKNTDSDIHRALCRLGSYLNMKTLVVSKEYRDAFMRALITFKHQLVFCPLQRKQVRLNPPTNDITQEQLYYAGKEVEADLAWQLALGNCDPFTFKKLHDFDPDSLQTERITRGKSNSWRTNNISKHVSIWSKEFIVKEKQSAKEEETISWPTTAGKVVVLKTTVKRKHTAIKHESHEDKEMETAELLEMYGTPESKNDSEETESENKTMLNLDRSFNGSDQTSPVLVRSSNPFAKEKTNQISPSTLNVKRRPFRRRNLARFKPTVIDSDVVTESKFFRGSISVEKLSCDPATTTSNVITNEYCKEQIHQVSKENNESESGLLSNMDNVFDKVVVTHASTVMDFNHQLRLPISKDQSMEVTETETTEELNSIVNVVSKVPLKEVCDGEVAMRSLRNNSDGNLTGEKDDDSRSSSSKSELDCSVDSTDITDARSNFSRWANPKANIEIINRIESSTSWNSLMGSRSISTRSQKTNTVGRGRGIKRTQSGKKKITDQDQQTNLKMFGFQKKTILKH